MADLDRHLTEEEKAEAFDDEVNNLREHEEEFQPCYCENIFDGISAIGEDRLKLAAFLDAFRNGHFKEVGEMIFDESDAIAMSKAIAEFKKRQKDSEDDRLIQAYEDRMYSY